MKKVKQDLIISLIAAIVFTVIILGLFFFMHTDRAFSYGGEFYLFQIICVLGLALIVCWGTCIKKYVYLELEALGEQKNIQFHMQVYSGAFIMVAFGMIFLWLLAKEGEYLIKHWLYLDELADWVAIMTLLTVICVGGLLCVIFQRRKIDSDTKCIVAVFIAGCVMVSLVLGMNTCMEYAMDDASWVNFHKSVEFTQENGPYVENPYN